MARRLTDRLDRITDALIGDALPPLSAILTDADAVAAAEARAALTPEQVAAVHAHRNGIFGVDFRPEDDDGPA